jgi:hypothetical protein
MTSTLERRIEQLSQQCARQRYVSSALWLVVIVSLAFIGWQNWGAQQPDVVRTKYLEIVNSANEPVVILSATPDGGLITTRHAGGMTSAVLGSSALTGDGNLTVYTQLGTPMVQLGASGDRALGVRTYTREGEVATLLGVDSFDNSTLRLQFGKQDRLRLLGSPVGGELWSWNQNDAAVFQLGTSPLGNGQLLASNESGTPIFKIGASVGGAGFLQTYNNMGTELVRLGATTNGIGLVLTSNPQGDPAVQLTGTADGYGAVSIHQTSLGDATLTLVPEDE